MRNVVKIVWEHKKIIKKKHRKILQDKNKQLSLHRYPENNLFTLKN